jgi:hypothetical protein
MQNTVLYIQLRYQQRPESEYEKNAALLLQPVAKQVDVSLELVILLSTNISIREYGTQAGAEIGVHCRQEESQSVPYSSTLMMQRDTSSPFLLIALRPFVSCLLFAFCLLTVKYKSY